MGANPRSEFEHAFRYMPLQEAQSRGSRQGPWQIEVVAHGMYLEVSIDSFIVLSLIDDSYDEGPLRFYTESASLGLREVSVESLSRPVIEEAAEKVYTTTHIADVATRMPAETAPVNGIDRIGIALNSSRPSASVDRTIAEVFPADFAPEAIITAMSTEIRINGTCDEDWRARLAGWPRDRVAELVAGMGYAPHAAEYQTPSKASFKVPGGADLDRVTSALIAAGLDCRVIHSGADDLDLLPPGVDKGAATLFWAEKLAI